MTDLQYPIGRFAAPETFTAPLRRQFLDEIAAVPVATRAAVAGLSADQLQTPYREGGWTAAQVVHHLADSHLNAYVRFKLARTESNPTIKPYDERRWAEEPDAATSDIGISLVLIDALHARWIASMQAYTDADWRLPFTHPERGVRTLDWMLAMYAWHGRHHVAHVTSLRARMGW
jgi:hypothetical protein